MNTTAATFHHLVLPPALTLSSLAFHLCSLPPSVLLLALLFVFIPSPSPEWSRAGYNFGFVEFNYALDGQPSVTASACDIDGKEQVIPAVLSAPSSLSSSRSSLTWSALPVWTSGQ